MPHIPSAYAQSRWEDCGMSWTSGNTTCWTNLTANATGNVKGSWTELKASTSFASEGFWLHLMGNTTAQHAVDIGIGAAGSEAVFVADISEVVTYANCAIRSLFFPLHIPAGVRIAARNAATVGSAVVKCGIQILEGGWFGMPGYTRCDTLTNGSNGRLLVVDPGGTANTKGAWYVISSSTPNAYGALLANFDTGSDMSRAATGYHLCDIGVGAAGAEAVVLPDLGSSQGTTTDATIAHHTVVPFECNIPAGARVVARCRSTITTASDRNLGVQLFGFY